MVVICDPPRGTLASAHGHDPVGTPCTRVEERASRTPCGLRSVVVSPRLVDARPHPVVSSLRCGAGCVPPHTLKGVTATQRWLADSDLCGILALLIRVTQAALFSPCHPHVGGGHAARALPAASRPRTCLPPLCRYRLRASCPVCQLRTVMVVCLHPPVRVQPPYRRRPVCHALARCVRRGTPATGDRDEPHQAPRSAVARRQFHLITDPTRSMWVEFPTVRWWLRELPSRTSRTTMDVG